jgi:predicted nucleic acid-binding protein
MGPQFLLDSNALIDYTGGRLPSSSALKIDGFLNEAFYLSIVVKIEVLGFRGPTAQMQQLEAFLSLAIPLHIDDEVIGRTIQLRRTYPKLKLGDALIASTALVHDLHLITRNLRDFRQIEGLTLIDPYTW